MTPAERAQKYMDEQYQVFNKFIAEMAPDVAKLETEPDLSGKLSDVSKYTRDAKRKMDQLEKREMHAWEEAYSNAPESEMGINKILDKIGKTINDTIRKSKNKAELSIQARKKSYEAT